ncbi:MAG: hypothetical protein M1396_04420 [Chloroflexi bacterium]|nr:hypothetical protein [Chloroflexota bacterium]
MVVRAVPGLRLNHDPGQFECVGFGPETYEPLYAATAHIHMRQARQGDCFRAHLRSPANSERSLHALKLPSIASTGKEV